MSEQAASRLAEVLDPVFAEGLAHLPIAEVRRRRDVVLAEREYQSYLRRLVQTRIDLLRAEQGRRREGAEPRPLVERLASALAEGGVKGPSRGEALVVQVSAVDLAEAQSRSDAITTVRDADPQSLSDEELAGALVALERAERAVSDDRAAVLRVHDRLQEEVKRRYRDDPSLIPREV